MIVKALIDTDHPVLAHVIPTRRCNIACGYCNEYDHVSRPVPIDELVNRTDLLANLGVSVVTLSGGEPMLHPQLDDLIRHIRKHGMLAGLITNGYLIGPKRIKQLNDAGLEYLQISIDNVEPDETSMKSLRILDKKLQMLAEHADFEININSVVGSGIPNPGDAYTVATRALDLGFTSTVGVIHDGDGQLKPLGKVERRVYEKVKALSKRGYSRLTYFQDNLVAGRTNKWHCRAGAPLPVHLRRRSRALLQPAARLARDPLGRLQGRRYPPGLPHGQVLRPGLHGLLRSQGFRRRFLA